MEIEERYGIRSTFFFRTIYEDGVLLDYENDITSLIAGGWEIGLHSDPSSIDAKDKILNEKMGLEELSKGVVKANRVHYLKFNNDLPAKLRELGFVYDSLKTFKHLMGAEDFGYYRFDGLLEFPITVMDAYLFTHIQVGEDDILPLFQRTIQEGRDLNHEELVDSKIDAKSVVISAGTKTNNVQIKARKVQIESNSSLTDCKLFSDGKIAIGHNTTVKERTVISAFKSISIGSQTIID